MLVFLDESYEEDGNGRFRYAYAGFGIDERQYRGLTAAIYQAKLLYFQQDQGFSDEERCEARKTKILTGDLPVEMGAFIVRFESPSLVFEKSLEPPLSDTLLTERQRKIVAYVREAESITNKQYRQLFDLKERRACEELVKMVGQEFLNRAGQGRTIH